MSTSLPTGAQLRQAYAAKQAYDDANAAYDLDGTMQRARETAASVSSTVSGAWDSMRSSVVRAGAAMEQSARAVAQRSASSNASREAGNARGERRWSCHACEKLPGGGRGTMHEGTIVQPAGVPMVLLEVKGEVVERTALPMGKDDLVKGEMLTLGKWLTRVVGLEGAIPEKPVIVNPVVVATSAVAAVDTLRDAIGGSTAPLMNAPVGAMEYRGQPVLVTEESAVRVATQTTAGGLQTTGMHREYYREAEPSHRYQQQREQSGAPTPVTRPKYQIYEPAPRFERAIDPDTGNPERWMGGGWRGRSYGDDRPRAVTQQEVEAARDRLIELEQEARIQAERAHAEAITRQQQAEAARLSAQSAMEQMSQAEAANRAVREAEMAAAEAKRLAYFAAQHQAQAESQFISMLPLDDVGQFAEEHRRASELEDLQRRIAAHEHAAASHVSSPTPLPQAMNYAQPQQHYYQPPQQQYQAPQQQQYQAPQQQQYQAPQQQPTQQHYQQQPVQVQYGEPSQRQAQPPSPPRRTQAEIEYTSSHSNVKDRAAAFGNVTIKPKPLSQSKVNPSAQTYLNNGSSATSASAHALAQVMRQGQPVQTTSVPSETPEELRRKVAILERLAQSRGLLPPK